MDKIGVFLADWQVLFREGIHFTLSGEADLEVIGEATSNEDALRAIEANPPDVAVLNMNHDKLGGIEVARYLGRNFPSVSVLLIMDSDNAEHLYLAMKSGASACLAKDADPADLVDSIHAIAQGRRPVSEALLRPEVASRVLDEFEEYRLISEQVDNLLARLTPGETEVLHRIANGAAMAEVCQTLDISEETVRRHFGYITTKLVSNAHIRGVIDAAQTGVLSMVFRARLSGRPASEFITRDEFAAFKDSVRERFRSATSDKI